MQKKIIAGMKEKTRLKLARNEILRFIVWNCSFYLRASHFADTARRGMKLHEHCSTRVEDESVVNLACRNINADCNTVGNEFKLSMVLWFRASQKMNEN